MSCKNCDEKLDIPQRRVLVVAHPGGWECAICGEFLNYNRTFCAQEVKRKATMENVEFLKSMQKLDVRDGDVVVINCSIPCEQMKILREYVNEFLDYMAVDAKIMFLPEGAEIGVLRKGE